MAKGVSIAKFEKHTCNEDALLVTSKCVAVSDGAGGSGVFADKWSNYLIEHLRKSPLDTFEKLDQWVDGLWEPFFNTHEAIAQQSDGMLLSKFYNEGAYATLAAVWRCGKRSCLWSTYGDSVVFHYNRKRRVLEHSFTRLADFALPPRLISCKDPLDREGYRTGKFIIDAHSMVFVASDALSHYILMMYALSKKEDYAIELQEEQNQQMANANLQQMAATIAYDFYTDVLKPLAEAVEDEAKFSAHIHGLYEQGLIDLDDYSLAFLQK